MRKRDANNLVIVTASARGFILVFLRNFHQSFWWAVAEEIYVISPSTGQPEDNSLACVFRSICYPVSSKLSPPPLMSKIKIKPSNFGAKKWHLKINGTHENNAIRRSKKHNCFCLAGYTALTEDWHLILITPNTLRLSCFFLILGKAYIKEQFPGKRKLAWGLFLSKQLYHH